MRSRLRENAAAIGLAVGGIMVVGWVGLYGWALTDYDFEVRPAFDALVQGHLLSFFQLAPAYGGSLVIRAPFVLTTTNRAAVERLTGARGVVEIFGKPYDLEQFAETVRRAVHAADPEHAGGTTPHGNVRRGADRRTGDRRREERRRNPSTD